MDPLSVTAGIIAVIQLTGVVVQYMNDVKDAPKECQHCASEASNLHSLLINLLYHLNQGHIGDAWFTSMRSLEVENGPLYQYKYALEQLQSKVEVRHGMQKIQRQLLWKFCKEDIETLLSRIERLKSLVSSMLALDNLYVENTS